ncbi:MAG: hypothetical protein KA206_01030 [Paludibacter sp.]|nr:hypothetical protein [Paludibacter sp.]
MANTTGKKFGGRESGTPNVKTAELKTWVKNLLETNQAQFEADLKALKASERVQIYERLLKYAIAPLQALSPEAQIQYEFLEMEKLLEKCPEDFIQKITEKLLTIKQIQQ